MRFQDNFKIDSPVDKWMELSISFTDVALFCKNIVLVTECHEKLIPLQIPRGLWRTLNKDKTKFQQCSSKSSRCSRMALQMYFYQHSQILIGSQGKKTSKTSITSKKLRNSSFDHFTYSRNGISLLARELSCLLAGLTLFVGFQNCRDC